MINVTEEFERRLKLALLRAMGETEEEAEAKGYKFVSYRNNPPPYEIASRVIKDCERLGLTPPYRFVDEEDME